MPHATESREPPDSTVANKDTNCGESSTYVINLHRPMPRSHRKNKRMPLPYKVMLLFILVVPVTVVSASASLVPDNNLHRKPPSMAARQCNVSVLSQSGNELENYIFSKTIALIYLNIVYNGEIYDDYKSPARWIWANHKGLNILQMDYRYMVFSLTTMGPSIYYPLNITIQDNPSGCCKNLPRQDKDEKIAFAVALVGKDFVDNAVQRDQYVCFQNYSMQNYSKQIRKTNSTKCKIVKFYQPKVNFFDGLNCSLDLSKANPDQWTNWCDLPPTVDGLYYMIQIFSAIFVLYALLLSGYIENTNEVLTREEIQNLKIPQFYQMDEKPVLHAYENKLVHNGTQGGLAEEKAPSIKCASREVSFSTNRPTHGHEVGQLVSKSVPNPADVQPNAIREETLITVDIHVPQKFTSDARGPSSASTTVMSATSQRDGLQTKKHAIYEGPRVDFKARQAASSNFNGLIVHSTSTDVGHFVSPNKHSVSKALIGTAHDSDEQSNYGTLKSGTNKDTVPQMPSYPNEYVTVNHMPAVGLANFFHFIWLSPASACVIRMRRLVFIIILPFHLYIMACIDLLIYPDATAFHALNTDPFVNTVDYFLILLKQGRLDGNARHMAHFYLFSLLTYGIAGFLFVLRAPLDLDHFSDDGKFLGRKLPESLQYFAKPPSHGWQQFFEVLRHRACLMVDKQFWGFYILDVAFNLHTILGDLFPEMRHQGLLSCFTACLYLPWLVCMCVAWLLLTPLGTMLNHLANTLLYGISPSLTPESPETREERLSGVVVGTKRRHFMTFFSMIMLFIWLFVALIEFLVVPTTHMLGGILRYTIQGLLLNHAKLLPQVILALATIFYVFKFYYELPDLYRRLTLTLFEEAANYQSQNVTNDSQDNDLLLTDVFGHKWLPRDLYKHVSSRLLPVRQATFRTGVKIILTLAFISFLYEILSHFDLFDDSGLGQALVTLLIVQAPRLTGLFPEYAGNCVDLFQQRGEVRSILESYVQHFQWGSRQIVSKKHSQGVQTDSNQG